MSCIFRSRASAIPDRRGALHIVQPLACSSGHRRTQYSPSHRCAAAQQDAAGQQEQQLQQHEEGEEFVGLLPEEDAEVPGNYMDAMNSNTKLGKAVRAAVEELEHLGDLETDVLQQCDELLRKLGMKGSIFGSNPPPHLQQQQAQDSSGGSSNS